MGLESINFVFRSDVNIGEKIKESTNYLEINSESFVYKKDNLFWIDIQVQNEYTVSVRIAFCNPLETTFEAMAHLFTNFFSWGKGSLKEMRTKKEYTYYTTDVRKEIENIYKTQRKIFTDIYGENIKAISGDKFYNSQQNKILEKN